MWRKKILPYFQYSRNERIGLLILVTIIILLWIIPVFLSSEEKPLSETEIRLLEVLKDSSYVATGNSYFSSSDVKDNDLTRNSTGGKTNEVRLYPFDPNSAATADWTSFGLRPKTISTIQNYLSKGGRFRRPEDLGKVYGLNEDTYRRLLPYVRIKEGRKEWLGPLPVRSEPERNVHAAERKFNTHKRLTPIDVNQADSSEWESLPGIGMKLTSRILKFRHQLGGFYSIDQVAETYGLHDSVFRKIKPWLRLEKDPVTRKLLINSMNSDELDLHPYISGKLAAVIVAYRQEHGLFDNPDGLKNIALMTDDLLQKITPYLDFSR